MKNEALFRTGSTWRAIFSMAIPSVFVIFVMILYNMADMFFVGRLGDTAQVAAVSVVSPAFSLLNAIATTIGAGGCAMIARCFGACDVEKGKTYTSLCLWSAAALGTIAGIVFFLAARPLLLLLGATTDMLGHAIAYLRILSIGAPFCLLSSSLGMLVRAEGAVKQCMVGNLLGTFTNLILDPLFILVMHWGVSGAAVATVLGNTVASCYYLHFIHRHGTVLTVDPRPALRQPASLLPVIAIGLPNGVSNLLNGFASSFSNRLLSCHGTGAIAAMSAAGKSTMLIGMTLMGIAMGCQPLLSYSYGSGDYRRLRDLLKKLVILSLSVGLGAGTLCYLFRDALIGLFLKEASVAALSRELVVYLMVGSPFIGFVYIATNLMQAIGKAPLATLLSILRQGLLLIPALYIFHTLYGLMGLSIAHIAADLLAAGAAVCVLLYYTRTLLKDKPTSH